MIKVTCALIVNDNRILAVQHGPGGGHPYEWEFPGGKTEPGETHEDAVRREIAEELGLDVKIVMPLNPVDHDYGFKKIRLIPFLCRIDQGVMHLQEHIGFKWMEVNNLERLDLSAADFKMIGDPHNRQMLKEYLREQVDNPCQ